MDFQVRQSLSELGQRLNHSCCTRQGELGYLWGELQVTAVSGGGTQQELKVADVAAGLMASHLLYGPLRYMGLKDKNVNNCTAKAL